MVAAAIVGPGNIGTDLMHKIEDRAEYIDLEAMVGILPVEESDGLQAAQERGIRVGTDGVDSLKEIADDIDLVFEATSAKIHQQHAPIYEELGLFAVDMTPAAIGPFVVPTVNAEAASQTENNINMNTCSGQATIPIVAAINDVADVEYAEIIAAAASRSAGPGTRQNIDEFTQETAEGLEDVGGAASGKAIIILNPAEPPITYRNTIYTRVPEGASVDELRDAVHQAEEAVQEDVPGYRVTLEPTRKEDIGFELDGSEIITTMVEVRGEGHYLPEYAGNLDIMTSAALGSAERIARNWAEAGRTPEVAQ